MNLQHLHQSLLEFAGIILLVLTLLKVILHEIKSLR